MNLRTSAVLGIAVAAASLPGCASDRPAPIPRQPYKVVLLPVEGAARALAQAAEGGGGTLGVGTGGGYVPLALTPPQLEAAVFDGIRKSEAFSELVVAPEDVARTVRAEDDLAAAADFARRTNADLLLRITVKSAQIKDLGNNGNTFWSTFTWFMVPLPIWTSDDRTYDTNLAVEAALFEPRDTQKPTASVVASSGEQSLDLWDRGLSLWVPIVPPPFLEGSPEKVSRTVTERAMGQLMDALVTELRTREIPSRFELAIVAEGGKARITAASRRALRSVEVFVAGRRTAFWAETGLQPEAATAGEDRLTYVRTCDLPAPRGGEPVEVRVIAEDEAGAREVRTIVLGRNE